MSDPVFFSAKGPVTLDEIARLAGVELPLGADGTRLVHVVAALDRAGPRAVAYCARADMGDALARTRAGACFVTADMAARLPASTIAFVTKAPGEAFATVAAAFHPGVGRPGSLFASQGVSPAATVHAEARLEAGVTIDPGAVIGPRVEIGSGTLIGANTVIGPDVRIGRDCAIGAQVTIICALLGNGVTISPGVSIGQDEPRSERNGADIAGIGRVIIQDRVEIGANSTIDRGGLSDTVIGEGSRIGSLVRIRRDQTIARLSIIRPVL